MTSLPEVPKASESTDFASNEEQEIARNWYRGASFEGRSSAEFEALREEVRRAKVLDFERYCSDEDYRRLAQENPFVRDFVSDESAITLLTIFEHKDEVGLSERQFEKLLAPFDAPVRAKFHAHLDMRGALRDAFQQLPTEESARFRRKVFFGMKQELDRQQSSSAPPVHPPEQTGS